MARSTALDVRPVFSHPLFLLTFLFAVVGWLTAFIGQSVLEAKWHAQGGAGSAVGVGWFGIFLQLGVIMGAFWTLATDSVGVHRFQLSIFLAIAVVFAVLGVNSGIFFATSFQRAIGAGWLLLSLVDIIWLFYFTSDEESSFLSVFNSAGSSFSRTPSSTRRTTRATGGVSSNSRANNSNDNNAVGNGSAGYSGSYAGVGKTGGSLAGGSVADLSGHQDERSGSPAVEGDSQVQEYNLKARALYSYSASPDDPNEISFAKGEILDIVDNSGKWWQARKSDGSKGIIPSNYVVAV